MANRADVIKPDERRGRGARTNAAGRFEAHAKARLDDGWGTVEEVGPSAQTTVTAEAVRKIITRNQSPDIPFDRSVNPYRGCEHGCIYCYARPSHAYMGLSPGLDFETRLFAKPDAAARLAAEIARPGYRCAPLAFGTNTDPYQPIERQWRLMRQCLDVLAQADHPVSITTKSHLVTRDLDLLAPMAAKGLVNVSLSVTTLDHRLARALEPRASTPRRRLAAVQALATAGVPTGVMVSPVIPALTDHEIEAILAAAAQAGAVEAGWILLRLPLEVKDLFQEWLADEAPERAGRIMSQIRAARGGRENDPRFHERFKGSGAAAEMIAQRFARARRAHGLERDDRPGLRTDLFRPPTGDCNQFDLFDG